MIEVEETHAQHISASQAAGKKAKEWISLSEAELMKDMKVNGTVQEEVEVGEKRGI